MTTVGPRDMPELRHRLQEYAELGGAEWFWRRHIANTGNLWGHDTEEQAAQVWAEYEVLRLAHAELFYVSENMCELIKQAAPAMPGYDLQPEDLPSRAGFVYFATPGAPGSHLHPRAASWGPMSMGPEGDQEDAVWVTWYAPSDKIAEAWLVPEDRNEFVGKVASLVIVAKALLPFGNRSVMHGMVDEQPVDLDDPMLAPPQERAKALITTWRLMQDKVSASHAVHASRSAQRRLRKLGEELKSVRVITLRTQSGESGDDSPSEREYLHRWVVRGHWRMQACGAGRTLRRPTWIVPHIKGPEGAPLLGGEKVYALKR